MRKVIPLIAIISLALFLSGCADIFIHVETDGNGEIVSKTYEVLSQDSMIGTQLSSEFAEMYDQYSDQQKKFIKIFYYRREAPFGAKMHIDYQKARNLGIDLPDINIDSEVIKCGIENGIEFVRYAIPPDPEADQGISGMGFLTINTSMPGCEDQQFGRGLERVLEEGAYYTVYSDGTEETLKLSIFEDPNLEQVIRETIDKPTGPIYNSYFEGITTLNASGREIETLEGIQHLKMLKKMNLNYNQISDITELASLSNLEELTLMSNQISYISPLANLTNLHTLVFIDNQVSDISQLTKLTNLNVLFFNNNQISDISPLANLTNLHTLGFGQNPVSDISPLADLTTLNVINFNDSQVSDISALQDLYKICKIYFSNNQVSDISPLADLTNLHVINFSNNQVSDISALVNNKGLGNSDFIILDNNPLKDAKDMKHIKLLKNRGVNFSY